MTSLLAVMAACMPASTIDINSVPIPYAQDCECSCGNCGRMGGVWLNRYSPCRCDTTIVLAEPFPLPPLREDLLDTQLHPSVYAPSLNSGYLGGLRHLVFAPTLDLIHPHYDHLLDLNHSPLNFNSRRFSDIGQGFPAAAVVPEPGTLALLVVGTAAIIRRRKRAT